MIPFLLRAVTLYGIDSVMCPTERRGPRHGAASPKCSTRTRSASMTSEVGLADLPALADEILAGRVRGRVIVATA